MNEVATTNTSQTLYFPNGISKSFGEKTKFIIESVIGADAITINAYLRTGVVRTVDVPRSDDKTDHGYFMAMAAGRGLANVVKAALTGLDFIATEENGLTIEAAIERKFTEFSQNIFVSRIYGNTEKKIPILVLVHARLEGLDISNPDQLDEALDWYNTMSKEERFEIQRAPKAATSKSKFIPAGKYYIPLMQLKAEQAATLAETLAKEAAAS